MLHWCLNLLESNPEIAPIAIFFLLILAGCCLPISIDFIILFAAILAGTSLPIFPLFISCFLGTILSSWIAYGIGRKFGQRVIEKRPLSFFLSKKRMLFVQKFYQRFGFLTLFIGRFIPFGIRNCLFLSSGMSKMPFWKFALFDLFAAFVWLSLFFGFFYHMSQSYEQMANQLKWFNWAIFLIFLVAITIIIWYLRKRYAKSAHSHITDKDPVSSPFFDSLSENPDPLHPSSRSK